jgi:modulator of FtsH protease HflC
MSRHGIALLVGVVALVVTVASSLYTVSETEQVVITQFGRPIGVAVTEPGLKVKWPFVQDINVFDKRWLEWDGDANQVPTRDKKYIWVDTYARWRIADPLRFFQRLRDERGAQSRLDDIIDGETRNVIASHNLIEVVRSSNRAFEQGEEAEDVMEVEEQKDVAHGRDRITRLILQRSSQVMPEFGIELVDVQIQRINYVESVQTKVFERMISERKRIADRHRSEGQGKSAEIRGKKERELKGIESEAYRKSQEVMGKADAEAASIYSAAYGRDGELYRFVRTLNMYRETVDKETTLVLGADAEIFRFLRSSAGGAAAPARSAPRAAAKTTVTQQP